MDQKHIREQLESFLSGRISINEVMRQIQGIQDISSSKLDIARQDRTGQAEVIYGEGKTATQITDLMRGLIKLKQPTLCTRIAHAHAEAAMKAIPGLSYDRVARCLWWRPTEDFITKDKVGVLFAGTTDLPVAREAQRTLETQGHLCKMYGDIGVAGIHRLFNELDEIRKHSLLIVIAGMEGALPSVVAGLVSAPLVAVPTSVGYGSNLQGLSTMLGMLSSCAPGIGVVNINNGYGAAMLADRFLRTK